MRAIASSTGVDYALDVTLNHDKQITAAFGGELLAMHARARRAAREIAMQPVSQLFDIVVTTNSGYPLDQNLYQAVKGMSAAANVVKPGGLIICASECRDGLPDHGLYAQLLTEADSPAELLELLSTSAQTRPDQWQVQIQARIQQRARIAVKADGLTGDQLRAAHIEPCHDIAKAVDQERRRVGDGGRICVLPQGPQTIPYLAS